MPFLLLICLMMACLPLPWPAPPEPLDELGSLLATSAAVALLLAAAGVNTVRTCRALRREPEQREQTLRRCAVFRHYHYLVSLAAYGLMLGGLGWGWLVERVCTLSDPPNLYLPGAELLILAPFLLTLIGSWYLAYGVERTIRETSRAEWREKYPFGGRLRFVLFHLRQNVVLVLAPLGLLIFQQGLVRAFPELPKSDWFRAAMLALVPGVLVAMPWLVRYGLGLTPMPPGPDRDRLEAVARRMKFRCTDLLVWHTGGGSVNAMVVGLVPGLRYVVFTDRLLTDLAPDEVEAVFGHEIGHVKHGHIPYYAGFLALSLTALLGAVTVLLEWAYHQPGWRSTVEQAADWLTVFPVAVLGGYVFLVFGYLSRRCERQADIYGCRAVSCGRAECVGHGPTTPAVGDGGLCPTGIETFTRALDKVAEFNGISRRRPGWLQAWQHSTIDRRIRFLERMRDEPDIEPRFQFRVRLLRWGLLLGLTAAIVGMGAAWGWDVVWRAL